MELLDQIEQVDEKHYISTVHKNSKGYITRAEINPNYKQWHYKFPELLKQDFTGENVYMSVSTYYKTYRRIECIKELRAMLIDLDIYNKGISKEKALMDLQENYYNTKIPIPSLTIDSGRGLYLLWLINPVPSMALPLWKAIEENFYDKLKDLGADRQALDPTRILRVPGSINTKSNTVVKVVEEYDYTYDLREIQEGYLPQLKPTEKKKGRPKKTVFIYRERSLYHARIQDIIKICELRSYDLRGHRELILFLYRYYLCYFTNDVQKALEDTLGLNMMFRYPLKENEVIRATRSAERVYQKKDKQYKYKNESLIELLDISEEEQLHLKTIISKEEYKRRDRVYQQKKYDSSKAKEKYQKSLKKSGKLSEKEKISQRREKLKDLRAKGLCRKDILLELDISLKTYKRDISFLKEQGLI